MDTSSHYEMKRVNKTLLISWLAIIIILLVAYSIEVVKGERTMEYIVSFGLTMLIPYVVTMLIYQRDKGWEYLGYVVVVGYTFMYAFVMFTGVTQMVSSYILPLLCFLILYHKPGLIIFSFFITLSVNIASLIYQLNANLITLSNSKDVEIRFAVIVVSFAGGLVSSRLYNSIHNENKIFTKELSEKNQEIQDMAIQTISTIANTIDAKDEYTRGHSKRVAEYSVAIANELEMPENEISQLRSIALLHDIGKIGVPDFVLNKPGRLTADEYELMKQHTVMGAEILKDITMLDGIDIGAKYHHERYDGNGYPEKKAGTDIPKIARIIAVADAFDAMTSNRVYRKQLDMDYVIGELKRCKGTQFDPEIDEALIKMLEEKRLVPGSADNTENMSELSKIWTRVIQKDEEKYKEKASFDELTGLYSRNAGEPLISSAVESNRGAMFVLDVDHFRKLNGEEGFLLGDIVLRCLSRSLEKIDHEKILARYGGDEFVAFLPDLVDKDKIEKILEDLFEEIANQRNLTQASIHFTVSAGVSICTEMKNVYQDCFLDADRALYMSKRGGGNRYTFYEKNTAEDGTSRNVDLMRLSDCIKHPEKLNEDVKYVSPESIEAIEIIRNLMEEAETPVQVILFTEKSNESSNATLDKQKEVMGFLEAAISKSIKGKDYTLRFSSTQRMIILTKAAEDGARAVSSHVMKEFYKLYNSKEINVSYDFIEFM